ncbi:glycerol-3-phosphate regulon repressor [Clostridium pasteurianum DSM 525 = ATCC 6013]|uniref:Glycerol-3-phosphate regulon repressor n=1 Tax=Clostridium pasteurianum DSM 525 = ATCC 6013 TaxID=1262449 RepID=A0A0H3J6S4_CLOPA|nr:DeoR/GlpR family DNA-binding transcription regulator [Clostridium pasteurianum]AJA46670.1 glycerol-3-phosphate regulon repressor [Clostridium pasteurianum DSM 525 = ATCC 6013]AJA50658.1 glycerol-3-phosphate regulon repressor [Clostridium pasteurianum DSM 525 = ATCC 6013]AOZ74079.1 DeoR family transcriptional regulator [Clostridium pasteurianum DSM 525 = ATCC 6013]AOZ77876.1 DeoR family transcriptional regulator [Clostridium pasteurianum]ELP61235.1 DeoR family transcriptional regulator [Clos
MFIEERHQHILDLLERDGKVLVKNLSAQFQVSESMIRKDLQVLEKNNLLQRTYGGAINIKRTIVNAESFFKRVEKNTDLKEIIAKKACELIKDGDTIFLDASSISYLLAKLIVQSSKNITFITNMVEISSLLHRDLKMNIIFIGGDYNPFVGGNIGSHSNEQIKLYRCNKSFIGCSGIDLRDGSISTGLSEDAGTKKAIMSISKELYLMAPNERFNLDGIFNFSNITDFHSIITETEPNNTIMTLLEQYDINLI